MFRALYAIEAIEIYWRTTFWGAYSRLSNGELTFLMGKDSNPIMGSWVIMLLLLLGRNVQRGEGAWDEVTSLELLDGEEFRRLAYPLVQMTANSYRYPAVIDIKGWTLVDAVAPIQGGMHAVLYKDNSSIHRMVLAFRGTDITGSESSRADLCADEILWGDIDILGPYNCSLFSSDTLDYYRQAVDYTRKVLEAHPDASLLLTGHSLGAGLAVLVTATFGPNPLLPVIAFGAPGTRKALAVRSLKLTADHNKKLYIIADEWDEIMRTTWENQVGTVCLYHTPKTEDCTACFKERKCLSSKAASVYPPGLDAADLGQREMMPQQHDLRGTSDGLPLSQLIEKKLVRKDINSDCLKCFFQTHYLKHVIDLVKLGERPLCEPLSPLEIV